MTRYFISGIGTGVGKTFVSAILTEALKADYWKPVQSGTEEGTDRERVSGLITNRKTKFFDEAYLFEHPLSPHFAAAKVNKTIDLEKITAPTTNNSLVIEGAGGLLVPLNDKSYVIDLAAKFDTEIILVCRNYLGCINHSLLSIEYILQHKLKLKGIVLNGYFEPEVRSAILNFKEVPLIAEIPEVVEISKRSVLQQSQKIDLSLFPQPEANNVA
jgi:dethiobiotin synthetase